jgi:hypothetical protein
MSQEQWTHSFSPSSMLFEGVLMCHGVHRLGGGGETALMSQ